MVLEDRAPADLFAALLASPHPSMLRRLVEPAPATPAQFSLGTDKRVCCTAPRLTKEGGRSQPHVSSRRRVSRSATAYHAGRQMRDRTQSAAYARRTATSSVWWS